MTVTLDYSADIQREIFGNHDGYVRKIEDDLHVAIIPRDGAVKVSGESRQVSSAVPVSCAAVLTLRNRTWIIRWK